MTDDEELEGLLDDSAGKMGQISLILYDALAEVISKSNNWRETIAEVRGEICDRVADIACSGNIDGDRETTHAAVRKQIDLLFGEMQDVIDMWAMRVMMPESSSSGDPILH